MHIIKTNSMNKLSRSEQICAERCSISLYVWFHIYSQQICMTHVNFNSKAKGDKKINATNKNLFWYNRRRNSLKMYANLLP